MVHHALPPEEWSVVYGFLGLFGEGGGREGGGVRSVSLWLEDPEEVSVLRPVSQSVSGCLQFSLGQSPDWWWRSCCNDFPQSPVLLRPSCEQSSAVRCN